jgi:hypothetical protein
MAQNRPARKWAWIVSLSCGDTHVLKRSLREVSKTRHLSDTTEKRECRNEINFLRATTLGKHKTTRKVG